MHVEDSSARADVGLAVAQYSPGTDVEANLERLRSAAAIAATRGADLVVAPEYASYFSGALGPDFVEHAEPLDGSFVNAVCETASDLGIAIVFGLVAADEADPARFRNRLVAVTADGEIAATYDKVHLYDAFGSRESDWVVAGELDAPATFVVGGLRFGLQTCYDLRFPESTRRLADADVDVVAIPAEWVRGPLKEHHWRTLAMARAIENTVYVAAADQSPPVAIGNSLIVDPRGTVLAGLGAGDGVAVAWATRAEIDAVRAENPALKLRRFQVVARGLGA